MRAALTGFGLALASLALAACGGGSGFSGPVTVAIVATPALDGFVTATGTVNTADVGASAGDSAGNDTARIFVSFPIGSIPAGATIQGATLELRQTVVLGTPYADLGFLVADHLDYGAALDAGDFGAASLSAAFGVFSTTAVLELKTLDVEPEVEADLLAARTRSQFRLRYGANTDSNFDDDYARFASADAAADRPVLRITYLP